MSWVELLKDNDALKRKKVQHVIELFREKADKIAGVGPKSNYKYNRLADMIMQLQSRGIYRDDSKFFNLYEDIVSIFKEGLQ